MSAPPRLGFVGLGWIGKMRLDAVAATGAAQVAALCDPVAERLDAAGTDHAGSVRLEHYEEMVERTEELGLDGLVIATPNSLHLPQTLSALDHGLAVFCQKPLGLDAAQVERQIRAARSADRLLGVDLSYRFTRGADELGRILRAGELGELLHVEAVFHNAYGPDKSWCFDPAMAGGGALMDLGVHLLDLVLHLLTPEDGPPPQILQAAGRSWPEADPIDRFTTARLLLDSGLPVHLAVSWEAHTGRDCDFRLRVHGSRGGACLRNVGGSFYDFELACFDGRSERITAREQGGWLDRGILDWTRRLGRSRRYDPEIERSLPVARALDAVYGRSG